MGGRVQGLGCGVNGDRESLLGLVGERLNDDSAETRLVGVTAEAFAAQVSHTLRG